ncbi:MAG: hypothetical protein J5I93_06985 [Pirellulaceae bacterium]|nr:hypothetical protein [Pirellulaceae bacterium]
MNVRVLSFGVVLVLVLVPVSLRGQQVRVSTPRSGVSDSFYEQYGTSWGFGGRNFFFNFGGPNPGLPPLGLGDPNAGARFGFGGAGGNGRFFLNGFASQGSDRTLVSETPMVVIPNGGVGSIASVLQRPFVTGLVPVVGGRNASPLLERLERLRQQSELGETPGSQAADGERAGRETGETSEGLPSARDVGNQVGQPSTASLGDLSVAEIQRQRAAAEQLEQQRQQIEVEQWLARAQDCEQQQKWGAARVYYQNAARQATGTLRQQLLAKIEELKTAR